MKSEKLYGGVDDVPEYGIKLLSKCDEARTEYLGT